MSKFQFAQANFYRLDLENGTSIEIGPMNPYRDPQPHVGDMQQTQWGMRRVATVTPFWSHGARYDEPLSA